MNGNKSVTAVFVQDQYTLTTAVTGSGSIDLNPAGRNVPVRHECPGNGAACCELAV